MKIVKIDHKTSSITYFNGLHFVTRTVSAEEIKKADKSLEVMGSDYAI